jgi:hypothetical protein
MRVHWIAAVTGLAIVSTAHAALIGGEAPRERPDASLNGLLAHGSDAPEYVPGSGWERFSWNGGPGVFHNEGPFTFTSTAELNYLKVTDAFLDGDQFEVYDFGELILTTSEPTDSGASIGDDFDGAFDDPRWSSGAVLLEPGPHSIEFFIIRVPDGFPSGGAAFEVEAFPTPGTLALLGLAGLAGRRRRD